MVNKNFELLINGQKEGLFSKLFKNMFFYGLTIAVTAGLYIQSTMHKNEVKIGGKKGEEANTETEQCKQTIYEPSALETRIEELSDDEEAFNPYVNKAREIYVQKVRLYRKRVKAEARKFLKNPNRGVKEHINEMVGDYGKEIIEECINEALGGYKDVSI